jgi:hypothetical protein
LGPPKVRRRLHGEACLEERSVSRQKVVLVLKVLLGTVSDPNDLL